MNLNKRLLKGIFFFFLFSFSSQAQDFNEVFKVVASDRFSGDHFGTSVSISGDYAIVGAAFEDHDASEMNRLEDAGSAYVFERGGDGNWNEAQKIVASDRAANDWFGNSVAISGNYVIVGARRGDKDASGMNTFDSSGSAYIFEKGEDGTWHEVQKIVASDRTAYDWFGNSVAISGNYAIVGAMIEDEDASGMNTFRDPGSAYIFERDETGNWHEVQKIVASDRANWDNFGSSVAISGNYAIVGAPVEDEDASGMNTVRDPGSAYIFERDETGNWHEIQKIVASDRAEEDWFGVSVSISGDYAIVGAYLEDEDSSGMNTFRDPGSAYIFGRDETGNWHEVQKIVASDRANWDNFGSSVTISGNYAVVGTPGRDEMVDGIDAFYNAGSAYVFKRDGDGNWNEIQNIVASDRDRDDLFGTSVSISGDDLIVGAIFEGEGVNTALERTGSAYMFSIEPESCELPSSIDIENIASNAVIIDWNEPTGAFFYNVYFRALGDTKWRILQTFNSRVRISGLKRKQVYEAQIKVFCREFGSRFTDVFTFSTTTSVEPINFAASSYGTFNQLGFAISPNPVKGNQLNIDFYIPGGEGNISVFHISGQKMAEQKVGAETGQLTLDLSNLENGSYIIQLQNGDQRISRQLIKLE